MRLQLAHSKLTSLVSELDTERRSELVESIQSESFFAMHRGKLPGTGDQPPAVRPVTRVFWNEFSIRGPKPGRSTVASQSAAFGALNEDGTKLYCADLHRLYIKDLKTGNTESITLRTIARNMGRISGMHYVAGEKQLLIDTQTGIWSVDVATKKPKLLHAKYSQRNTTSTYSPKHKCWFALEQERRSNSEITRIRRYNEHYAPIDQVVLSKAITRGARSFSSSIPPQLVSVGDHLAVIDYLQKREVVRINGRTSSRSNYVGSITVFDPSSGEIVHEAELEPCVEFRDLSPPQLQALWQKLSLAGDQDAEALMWQLASGGELTFEFLKDKFPKLVRDSEIDVDALVAKLDDNRFSVRDRAYRTLRDTGSQIEPELRAMIQGDVTPEVRERLESLIAQWNIGAPQNAEQLQKVRGIEVLYRIGDKNSRQLLDSLTSDEQASYVRVQATRSLKGESVVTDGFQNPAVRLQNQLFVPR